MSSCPGRIGPPPPAQIENLLDKEGVDWVFHPEIVLRAFDEKKSLHNRVRFQPLDGTS